MDSKKLLKIVFTVILLGIGATIVSHFLPIKSIDEIQRVPVFIMVMCLCYVLIQILKRQLVKNQNWWDWLYYIGLLAVMVPPYLIEESNADTYIMLANYGPFFLILPVVADGIQIFQKKKS